MVAFHLTSKKNNTAISHVMPSNHSTYSTGSEGYFLGGSNATSRGRESSGHSGGGRDLIDFETERSNDASTAAAGMVFHARSSASSSFPAAAAGLTAISEALNTVESLRMDLEKMQMGIQLLTLSVTKLTDIVTTEPAFCGGIFEMFLGGSSQGNGPMHSPSSHYRVTINRNISGNYTTGTNNILHSSSAVHKTNSNDSQTDAHSTNMKKSSFNFIANSKNRKQGYENLGGNHFTIEGVDEYDD